jgi:hypothetical protein
MHARAVIVSMFLLGISAAPAVQAVEVTTYGAGLQSCGTYLDTRNQENASEVAYVDWLSGYLSGANTASKRMNDMLGSANLASAVYWIGRYCQAHGAAPFSKAAYSLLMAASASRATQDAEATTYGAGFKLCQAYVDARVQQGGDAAAFIDWFGGYLSGVNAMSLSTNNILGDSALAQAVAWIDNYCVAHPEARFAMAVNARIAANHLDQAALNH